MATYQVTLKDGNLVTRNSDRVYTHAVISTLVFRGEPNGVKVFFTGSLDLAQSKMTSFQKKVSKNSWVGTTSEVVKVEVIA
jgi:hypothetical protein